MEHAVVMASTVASLILTETVKKVGSELGQKVISILSQIREQVRGKFQKVKLEGILDSALQEKSDSSREIFEKVLASQINSDPDFANEISNLIEQVKSEQKSIQKALTDIEIEGTLKGKDVHQSASGINSISQEAVRNIKAKSIDVGNITQTS